MKNHVIVISSNTNNTHSKQYYYTKQMLGDNTIIDFITNTFLLNDNIYDCTLLYIIHELFTIIHY